MIVEDGVHSEVGLFTIKHGPHEPPHCKNCYQRWRHHTDGKCVFEASTYEPWKPQGKVLMSDGSEVDVVKFGTIQKIQVK